MFFFLTTIACGVDYGIWWAGGREDDTGGQDGPWFQLPDSGIEDTGSGGGDDTGNGGGGGDTGNGGGGGGGDTGGGGGGDTGSTGPDPGETKDNPRDPAKGELVLTELMIDPDGTSDADGEWVEILNTSDDWLDLTGHVLADNGKDTYTIERVSKGSLTVGPGEYIVVCANDSWWDNGGVDCHGTFLYQTWGGGFALSNTEDEVILKGPSGTVLDKITYGEGFAIVGGSLGVDPSYATVSKNDDLDEWCEQFSSLSSGDSGTPGLENDWCW